jgi:hypothetical protein
MQTKIFFPFRFGLVTVEQKQLSEPSTSTTRIEMNLNCSYVHICSVNIERLGDKYSFNFTRFS